MSNRAAAILGGIVFAVLALFAITGDTPRIGPGIQGDIKGDEATYVAAALSLAYDGDLIFQQKDLERFEALYHRGPEGIFLKRGQYARLSVSASAPFVQVTRTDDIRIDRLHFGKALLYPVAAAPFVRLFGMNGLMLLHVVVLALMAWAGYAFLSAQMSNLTALVFVTAFLGASALPVYAVFLTPELLMVGLVFVAYVLWAYKLVTPNPARHGIWTDLAAAALLGFVTYAKPTNGVLIAPLVLYPWFCRRWIAGLVVAISFAAAVGAGFGLTFAVTGELNYQGGDRKTFYGRFPFEGDTFGWEERGGRATTDGTAAQEMLTSPELGSRLVTNVRYFLVGRHFGLLPYSFPGVVAIVLWLWSPARRDAWRLLSFLAFFGTALALLLLMPYTWSGGGGPTGNRYLLSAYPALFVLIPPLSVTWPAVVAWIGGALFTAKILLNPFVAARYPYLTPERGFLKRLPVELTMANDLPVMLAQPIRARIPYGQDPPMLLYFLDQNAFPPEQVGPGDYGIWIAGGRRAEILIRTSQPLDRLRVTTESRVPTTVRFSMGGPSVSAQLQRDHVAMLEMTVSGERGLNSYAYLLTAESSDGFVPRVREPGSEDGRNLGALIRLQGVSK